MRRIWTFFLVAAAASGAEKRQPDIVVYFHTENTDPRVIGSAEGHAKDILEKAGVEIEWRLGKPKPHGGTEVIEAVLTEPEESFELGALAYALLGVESGTRIEVFYNRICHSRSPPRFRRCWPMFWLMRSRTSSKE